jgi:hypothetical protein
MGFKNKHMKNHFTKEVLEAKAVLKENGFYVDNLWHIDDVDLFEIDECFEILSEAIEQDYIYERINESIQDLIKNR